MLDLVVIQTDSSFPISNYRGEFKKQPNSNAENIFYNSFFGKEKLQRFQFFGRGFLDLMIK